MPFIYSIILPVHNALWQAIPSVNQALPQVGLRLELASDTHDPASCLTFDSQLDLEASPKE